MADKVEIVHWSTGGRCHKTVSVDQLEGEIRFLAGSGKVLHNLVEFRVVGAREFQQVRLSDFAS